MIYNNDTILIIAPAPARLKDIKNGWTDRINEIDTIFGDKNRIYIFCCTDHEGSPTSFIKKYSRNVQEIILNPKKEEHRKYLQSLAKQSKFIYVHTLHYAEHVLDLLDIAKVIVDIHGVTPEEEEMLGRPELKPLYEKVEQEVLKKAYLCIFVSQAMRTHYQKKYPKISCKSIILPIIQKYPINFKSKHPVNRRRELPVSVVYAGGTQVWQNIDLMIEIAAATQHFAKYEFLSDHWEEIKKKADAIINSDRITYGFVKKKELVNHYIDSDFGFILRDDSPVNRVASPTKLFDYCFFGIIPIVKSVDLGDFKELGYEYITHEDFINGFFPDSSTREWIINNNQKIIKKLNGTFNYSVEYIKNI